MKLESQAICISIPPHLQAFLPFLSRKSCWKSSALNEPTYFGRGTMKDALRFTFGIFGNVTALALFLAPVITFYKIVRRGSTEDFSGIPYVFTMLNCLLYAWYGLPFITSHNLLLTTVNGAGAALEFIYVCIFLLYAPPKPRWQLFHYWECITMQGNCLWVRLQQHFLCRLVIQTKSVQYMPFFLSLFVFLCGTSWFLYGIFGKDAFVAAPNGIGASLGIAQLVLYFIYKDSAPAVDKLADNEGRQGHEVEKPFPFTKDETKLDAKGSSRV